jgi:AraC-like DNA-binding protein
VGANERTNIYIGQVAMNVELIFLLIMTVLKTDIIGSEKIDDKKTCYKIHENQADEYWKTLTTYMNVHKPYLKEDCNLRTLAIQINIPDHHLTNTLNAYIGKSFADFINTYRVEEAKIYLQDKSLNAKNVDEIGFKCGFGSRSSFFRIFKKITTLTPTEYRKQFLESLQS